MKISVIGGGPGGLYFSILTKKRIPNCTIDVYEQNQPDDAFGFGVVFSDETLSEFLSYDTPSYELIRKSFAYWDNLDIVRNGQKIRIKGNGFCGCSRKTLLQLMQQRCKELGVNFHFKTRIDDLSPYKDSDIILAADGINSPIRSKNEDKFGTKITMKTNRFIWLGSPKPLDAFTYFFRETPHGVICAHTYQYEKGHSTWIFECSNDTFLKTGLDVNDETASIKLLQDLFKDELQGFPLIGNRSFWRQFPHVENKNWFFDNIVILGDAKATAHYSIGSGTKLAMDCAIGLSDAVVANQNNIQKAFQQYDQVRRNPVESIQHAALVSLDWFENLDRHVKNLDFDTFTFSLMSRSKKITIENQARRDKDYATQIIHAFNKTNNVQNLDTPPILTPFNIANLQLNNRIVMSPMGQYCAKDGLVSDWHFIHYTTRAIGGVGLIIAEMTAISSHARITPHCPGIWNDDQVQAWKKITDFIHQNTTTKIAIQLGHSGRKGNCTIDQKGSLIPASTPNNTLVSSSPLPYGHKYETPQELTLQGMDYITSQFENAAKNAIKAGFDMIELQAHHGFLLASFISPLTNQRKDEFGGNIHNRMKFPLRVLKAIKNNIPSTTPISVRISATDWAEGGISQQDVLTFTKLFIDNGANVINVSTGNTVEHQNPMRGRMWQSPFAELIKDNLKIPTITAGNIQDEDQANTLLLNHRADLIALGRPLLLDPYFVQQIYAKYNTNISPTLPKQYFAGTSHTYPFLSKQKQEIENMKIKLKPKSHQNY